MKRGIGEINDDLSRSSEPQRTAKVLILPCLQAFRACNKNADLDTHRINISVLIWYRFIIII